MVELGHRLRLSFEAGLRLGVGGEVLVQQLDRDLALQRLVVRAKDDGHAPLTDLVDEPIALGDLGFLHSHHDDPVIGLG